MQRLFLSALIFLFSSSAFCQVNHYQGSRLLHTTPTIDGKIDEACWENATWGKNFTQFEPKSGEKPAQQTEFAILYDDNNLYVAIKALDAEPDKIVKHVTRRDNFEGDWVGICIDSYEDKMTGFCFCVSAAGSKNDFLITNNSDEDETWDPLWEVKTYMGKEGWYAEMRIPYSQLRFAKKENYNWGLEIIRYVHRNKEKSFWQPLDKGSSQFVGKFGTLTGIQNIKPKKDIEIFPFVLTKLTLDKKEDGNPFATGKRITASGGVDGKISLTNNLTLNFTINPDFGQVEADPSEVNLSNFETYFEEKRPFFVEGSNIFNFPFDLNNNGRERLFYSRRLGREPHLSYDTQDDEYVREPQKTNILGAAKISGKTKKGTSIGVLNAITQKMYTQIDKNGERSHSAVEPFTNYFVSRVEQDLDNGNTIIGGMLTATNRNIDDAQFNEVAKSAYTGGANFTKYWKDKAYFFKARSFFSNVNGSTEAITALQKSSTHYYQRPDATHIKLDTTRGHLNGWGGSIEGGKESGHWNFIVLSSWSSPGLDFNDIGFKQNVDQFMYGFWNAYKEWSPKYFYNSYNINASAYQTFNFEGKMLGSGMNMNTNVQFKNYYSSYVGFNLKSDGLSTNILRGGPSMKTAGNINFWYGINSDNRKKLVINVSLGGNYGLSKSSTSNRYEFSIQYKPNNNISLSLNPEYAISSSKLQYVKAFENASQPTYLFATLNRKTVSLSARVNVGITPDMSLQFYAQPYLFSGKYEEFKVITQPQANNFNDRFHVLNSSEISFDKPKDAYELILDNGTTKRTLDNPDFHFLQFRSNLVFRWEYKPGSVFYLVWAQGRTINGDDGDFHFNTYTRDLFNAKPQNDFLVKISYALIF